ncbi:MAG: flagellar basal-body rod protein FlgG [Armatimonadetes bacterium]|uniref:Flagellar basal-body rod protein FlgG n=1 Tax=Candidatus Nitrosymbiomonas proteolyticus TaxID=2608984 RepID=A0A809RU09_9BACT|nr:MAG: flagellar basal-body rod protein FlgG [Armatimonadota bacterium]WKZ79459.1 MAG: flagellar basal-body rod protein FlgG [Fimbriimonadaceae bacterium]BBO23252.1 flagellar basal-body rod protein FlgG [Candidatus Nitrosymbiomonas proteolyticus]MBL1151156.1 flagellar basal-body rod protein FlgG [Armatimonadota bacterium]NOG37813.1 flagellar basal-body rod protein FlgG [Armatimonadota bacterium]
MMRSLTTAGTGMVAQQMNLDTIANNLANVNTTAFKQQRAEFQDLMYQIYKVSGTSTGAGAQQPITLNVGLGSKFSANATSFNSGPLLATGNPLDLAISGEGFFEIELPNGTLAYTRDGSFKVDANGILVTSDGYPLSPSITIPTGVTAVSVSESGVISALLPDTNEPQELGQLTVAIFPNPSGLIRLGQNLYEAGGASGTPTTVNPGEEGSGRIQAGFLEGSNVQIVEEMVRMILAQRAYEINSKAIQTADDMLGMLNNLKR